MKALVYNNFVSGVLDNSLNGRFESPFYTKGFSFSNNFLSTYRGNLKNRTGWEYITRTIGDEKAFMFEFKFNNEQSYLVVASEGLFRFFTYDAEGNFGYVVNDEGTPIVLSSGITYEQMTTARLAQNADVIYITGNFHPQILRRKSAIEFTIENALPNGINYNELGYPRACCFFRGRLYFGGFEKKPTTIRGSKVTDYENFVVPASDIKSDDPLDLTLSDISLPIMWMMGGNNNLIVGNGEGMSVVNGGEYGTAIESTKVSANLANKQGANSATPIEKDSLLIYFDNNGKGAYSFEYDYLTEVFNANDLNLLATEVIKSPIKQAVFKDDSDKLIYCLLENGTMMALLYNKAEGIFGWFPITTNGFVHHIAIATKNNGDKDLFLCVEREGHIYIERSTDAVLISDSLFLGVDDTDENYKRLVSEEAKGWNYLDCSSVYKREYTSQIEYKGDHLIGTEFTSDMVGHYVVYKTKTGKEIGVFRIDEFVDATRVNGKMTSDVMYPEVYSSWYVSFSEINNFTDYNKVTVVADGGYVGDLDVVDGKITLDREYTVVCVGYRYESLYKSFNIGTYAQNINFQTTIKNINEFTLRCVHSAGGKVGTTFSAMSELQEFSPFGFYDTIPMPINGDVFVKGYKDTSGKDKRLYIKQDLPLPLNVTMVEFGLTFGTAR